VVILSWPNTGYSH